MSFRFDLKTLILFGTGSIKELGEEAAKLGHKVMIITYPDIRRIGLLDTVVRDLRGKNIEVIVFDKIEPNPRTTTVDEGAKIARKENIDLVIGLGGGSVMDAAKGIALACSGTAPIWDYWLNRTEAKGAVPPIIQVPTIAGTGSEINPGAVLTNWETHIKEPVSDPRIQATVAIIDPEITLSVPLHQTKAGGFDIFTHVAEPYLTDSNPRPLTDGIRETCMKMVVKYLPRVITHLNDLEARTELSWASTIAMSQFAFLGSNYDVSATCHSIEHALSGYYDITHGDGLAALFPAWMGSFSRVREERFRSLGRNVFGKEDGLKAMVEFLESVGMRLRLRDLGCKLGDAELIADLAIKSSPMVKTHPTPLDANAIAKIYRDSY